MLPDTATAGMSTAGAQQPAGRRPSVQPESNPFRNLGSAMEEWKSRLPVVTDAQEDVDGEGTEAEGDVDVEPPQGAEFRFLGVNEGQQAGDTQALAPATEDQAAAQGVEDLHQDDAEVPDAEDHAVDDMEVEEPDGAPPPPGDLLGGKANWGAGAGRQAGMQEGQGEDEELASADVSGDGDEGVAALQDAEREVGADGFVISQLQATNLEDSPSQADINELLDVLSDERAQAIRDELDSRLKAASEGGIGLEGEAHGREVWTRCEALTAGLVGELAEQLRLILEPTLASKLAGDYRTGKRINMKKVIGYIASHFRKDKIWMRRTQPDKRSYQVVVAVDDSRSMAETGCGTFALEALTLICRAMARLDVGELGVVSYGGAGGAQPLHPLERPFTDADGVRIMSAMRFDQDNTITDRPMVDVITSLDHLLEGARARGSARNGGQTALHQLVLVVADGRFHEKDSLRRAVREAASKQGVLYAFIVLDNPVNSILDMQTVSFVAGKPAFAKYMDSFPFPFYIVLRDTAALPHALADLLRQWFELSSSGVV